MNEISDYQTDDLARWLRRGIAVLGYTLGGWAVFENVVNVIIYGWNFAFFAEASMRAAYRVLASICFAAPLLLLVGTWAFQHRRRWARLALTTYAVTWICGFVGTQVLVYILIIRQPPNVAANVRGPFGFLLWNVGALVHHGLFPVILLFCLGRPELRDRYRNTHRGFRPVLKLKETP